MYKLFLGTHYKVDSIRLNNSVKLFEINLGHFMYTMTELINDYDIDT